MTKKEAEAYEIGCAKGRHDARTMKENADGCKDCYFDDVNSWELPCRECKRNSKDYWRAKVVE